MTDAARVLLDLVRAKATFQLRALTAIVRQRPDQNPIKCSQPAPKQETRP